MSVICECSETVKDLGKGLGYFVIVNNCSEGLDYKSMGRMLSGLAQVRIPKFTFLTTVHCTLLSLCTIYRCVPVYSFILLYIYIRLRVIMYVFNVLYSYSILLNHLRANLFPQRHQPNVIKQR